jgi:hypothetical protein
MKNAMFKEWIQRFQALQVVWRHYFLVMSDVFRFDVASLQATSLV